MYYLAKGAQGMSPSLPPSLSCIAAAMTDTIGFAQQQERLQLYSAGAGCSWSVVLWDLLGIALW